MLRRQRATEIVPSGKPLRWRRYDVPQHLAPETSEALGFCAVEGDLDLPDRRHRSTIEAGSVAVSTGPAPLPACLPGPGVDDAGVSVVPARAAPDPRVGTTTPEITQICVISGIHVACCTCQPMPRSPSPI